MNDTQAGTVAIIRLRAACFEWRELYRAFAGMSAEEKQAARKRMSELSPEITALENATGIPSRQVEV